MLSIEYEPFSWLPSIISYFMFDLTSVLIEPYLLILQVSNRLEIDPLLSKPALLYSARNAGYGSCS